MEHPPLIDVEPDDSGRSSKAGCGGCLRKLVYLALILVALAGGVYFLDLGDDPNAPSEKGVSGLVQKVKQILKLEKKAKNTTSSTGNPTPVNQQNEISTLPQTVEANAQALDQDSQTQAPSEKTENILSPPKPRRQHRGGAFGSSTGSPVPVGNNNQYRRWRGNLSTSGSDLTFEIIFQESGGQLQYRCFVQPYDTQTAQLFRADKGDFLLSFADTRGQRLIPFADELELPLTQMTAFENQGRVAGWVTRGMISLEGKTLSELQSVKLGWNLDKDLSDWLKHLPQTR